VLEAVVISILLVTAAGQSPADSLRQAERDARTSARHYERLRLSTAPQRFGGGYGDRCDERIGRFCFWFSDPGTPRRPIDEDAPRVVAAREGAIHAHRRWFALAPHEFEAAGPLVRYLVEAGRPAEAAAAARAHVWAAKRSAESLLLLGLAVHYTGAFVAAEEAFDSARATSSDRDRRDLDDLGVLLTSAENALYRRLSAPERARYEETYWALSDPWLMVPGNERRSAHYARHAWARVLARAPHVEGKLRWGRDHTEILIRYGRPTGRQRVMETASLAHNRLSLVEWFDPRRVALAPPDLLTGGIPAAPPAGVRPEIERDTVRSHYAPLGMRRTRGLVVQPSVFPGSEHGVVRVDALMPPDSLDPRIPIAPRGLLVMLDTLGREVARTAVTPRVRSDSMTVLAAEQAVRPGTYIYRVELRDDATGLGALAQYRVRVPPARGLTVSDLLVALPVPTGSPRSRADSSFEASPSLVLRPGQEVGLYAEISGLQPELPGRRFEVQWWVEGAEDPGLLHRAASWLGRRVGLLGDEEPTRVAWSESASEDVQVVFLTLTLNDMGPGLYRLGLLVRDPVTGQERTTTRLIRIDPAAPPLPPRTNN
jgi:hypothetical protein